jgi:hypothetical protein
MDRISQHISEKHEADWFVSEDRLWNRLVDRLVILFRFSAEEETRIRENQTPEDALPSSGIRRM